MICLGIWDLFSDLFGDLGILGFAICLGSLGFGDLFFSRFVWGFGDLRDLGICFFRDLFGDLGIF